MSELQVPPATSAMDNPDSKSGPANGTPTEANDISMTDAPAQAIPTQPSEPQPQHPPLPEATTVSPAAPAARVPTPVPTPVQQQQPTSRAASQHPDPATAGAGTSTGTGGGTGAGGFTMPAEAAPHGAPVRQYINSKITGVLLDGMKIVAREQ
ncbi:hypothetical protein C7999DRAFT_41292 [Corynascus novoguineensis]|uniref:Uncharacterized protein n=1 Tax=Corynascus novoguineensis TaxID=1126955 RepID=A0AAN7CT79_9PEZI|nr:hypothetical protein C7999DRAFT_41292 [Corynascus novoguineensis]